jgi:hypothetical protein
LEVTRAVNAQLIKELKRSAIGTELRAAIANAKSAFAVKERELGLLNKEIGQAQADTSLPT